MSRDFADAPLAPAGASWGRYAIYALGAVFLSFALVLAGFMLVETERQLNRRIAESDDLTWVVSQLEVDLKNLQFALLTAHDDAFHGEGDMDEALDLVREKFDIFYSRVDLVNRSQLGRLIEERDDGLTGGKLYRPFFDRFIPIVDGPDQGLIDAMDEMIATLQSLNDRTRDVVLLVMQELMQEAFNSRTDLRNSLIQFASGTFLMLVALAIVLVMGAVLLKRQRNQSRSYSRALANMRAILHSAQDAIIVIDADGKIIEFNPSAEDMLGHKRDAILFSDLDLFVQGRVEKVSIQAEIDRLRKRAASDRSYDRLIRMDARRADGTIVPVEVSIGLAHGAGDKPLVIAFVRDISRRLQREDHLKRARNDAMKGEEAKTRFLTVMSHELRTPLNGILAGIELMKTTTRLDDRQNWLVDVAERCGVTALEQVNNVLELTRMESGSSAVYPESVFDPLALVRDLAGMAALQAETQGSMVEVTLGPDCVDNISVLASEQLFKNVVFNFIGNAVKFTIPPGVSVFYEATYGVTRQDIDILIEVRDHGPGIAEENLGRIFDNFETLDGSYARKNEGSGLGLGIAKRAADAMGGQISVTSRLGEGSTFSLRVRLPIARRRAQGTSQPASAEVVELFRPLNLLVVEDNEINRSILRETLISLGHEVVEAVDGQEAVDLAKDTRFDGILMDISMPRMDGVEATKHIRAGGACRDVPIVGVTAHATPDQFRLFIDSGMNEVVVKPVRQSHLKRALNTIMRGRPAAEGEGAEPPAATPDPTPAAVTPEGPLPPVNGELLDLELFESLREALGDDLLQQHFNTFLSESETAMGELRALTDEGDYANAARVAHKAAGAAAVLGAMHLRNVLAQFEDIAKGDTPERCVELMDDIAPAIPSAEGLFPAA